MAWRLDRTKVSIREIVVIFLVTAICSYVVIYALIPKPIQPRELTEGEMAFFLKQARGSKHHKANGGVQETNELLLLKELAKESDMSLKEMIRKGLLDPAILEKVRSQARLEKGLKSYVDISKIGRAGIPDASDQNCYVHQKDSSGRCAPHFVVGGAFKGGTTSLYGYLAQHPQVALLGVPSPYTEATNVSLPDAAMVHIKEPVYWGMRQNIGVTYNAYRQTMPDIYPGEHIVTGEASPSYIYTPRSMIEIRRNLPNARVIFTLREPIARAVSRINHLFQLAFNDTTGMEDLFDIIVQMSLDNTRQVTNEFLAYLDAGDDRYDYEQFYLGLGRMRPGEPFYRNRTAASALKMAGAALSDDDQLAEEHLHMDALVKLIINNATAAEEANRARIEAKHNDGEFGDQDGFDEADEGAKDSLATPEEVMAWKRQWTAARYALTVKPLEHSVYYPQLKWWLDNWPRDQLLILRAEDFFGDTAAVMDEVTDFLRLDPFDWSQVVKTKFNVKAPGNDADPNAETKKQKKTKSKIASEAATASRHDLHPETFAALAAFYDPLNKRLEDLLGRKLWSYDPDVLAAGAAANGDAAAGVRGGGDEL